MLEISNQYWRPVVLSTLLLLALTVISALLLTQPWTLSVIGISAAFDAVFPVWGLVLLVGATLTLGCAIGLLSYYSYNQNNNNKDQHNDKLNYNEPLKTLINDHRFRDPLNVIMGYLSARDLQMMAVVAKMMQNRSDRHHNNSLITGNCFADFFSDSKRAYLKKTLHWRARYLRDCILDWDYAEIEKTVRIDPKVLTVPMSYTMNCWQDMDTESIELSALEYAYRTFDQNLMKLFNEMGRGIFCPEHTQRLASLKAESAQELTELANLIDAYVCCPPHRLNLMKAWAAAPLWLHGLDLYCRSRQISGREHLWRLNIYSLECRKNIGIAKLVGLSPPMKLAALKAYIKKLLEDCDPDISQSISSNKLAK